MNRPPRVAILFVLIEVVSFPNFLQRGAFYFFYILHVG